MTGTAPAVTTAVDGMVTSTSGADADARFYAGSLTKQVIGLLAARATVRGALAPSHPVRHYLPDLASTFDPLTVRHLLHHLGDLPQPPQLARAAGRAGDDAEVWVSLTNADVRATLGAQRMPATWRPGLAFGYDNTGYILLAEVIDTVGDLRAAAADLFREYGMDATALGARSGETDAWPRTIGDGGLWTSARDLLRWQSALNDGVDRDEVARAETEGTTDDGRPVGYAWGTRVIPSTTGPVYAHGGSWPGSHCYIARRRSSHDAVVAWTAAGEATAARSAALGAYGVAG